MNGEPEEYEGFERGEAKSRATLAERSFDFEFAARVFEAAHIEIEDRRQDYGERRLVVIGEVHDRVITVVWTPRNRRRRIVTAWPASNRERREYRDYRKTLERRDLGQ